MAARSGIRDRLGIRVMEGRLQAPTLRSYGANATSDLTDLAGTSRKMAAYVQALTVAFTESE